MQLRQLAYLGIVLGGDAAHAQMNMETETETEMDMGSMQGGSPPPDARDPHAYAEGVSFTRGDARPRLADEQNFRSLLIDNLEVSRIDGETVLPYDVEAWFGRTYDRAVLKAEGDLENGDLADSRTELLWGHAIAAYWDTQVGIRYDSGEGPSRSWLAAGIEGLAPYWFDLEVTGYVGESNRTALRIDASYDMLIDQRLILQPRFEANFYGKDDFARGLASGLSDVSLALRLRYEIRRELAPYIGVERVSQHGGTEDLTRAAGGDSSDTRLTMGLRFWF
jgi:copper resistance protein B